MNKNCKEILKLLSNYIENDLDEKNRKEVEYHLSICGKCKKEFEDLCKTVEMIKNLPKYTIPSSVLTKINKKIEERKTFWEKISPFSFRISLGTISLVIIVLVSFQLYRYVSVNEKKIIKEYKLDSSKKETIRKLEKKSKDRFEGETDKLEALKKEVSKDKNVISDGILKEGLRGGEVVSNNKRAEKSLKKDILSLGMVKESKPELSELKTSEKGKDTEFELSSSSEVFRRKESKEFSELKGVICNFKEKDNFIIKTQSDWENLWKKAFPEQEIPRIDFDKKMVVAIFSGEKQTGGYEINIKEINYEKDKIIVKISESTPSKDAFVITAITSPFHIKVINKSDLPVEFIFE
jgi:hypothetical protein